MDSAADRVLVLLGAEVREGSEDGHIDTAVDGPLECAETDEAALRRDLDPLAEASLLLAIIASFEALFKRSQAAFEAVLKQVGGGPEHDRALGVERLGRSARATPPTADQRYLEGLVRRGVHARHNHRRGNSAGSHAGGPPQELAARGVLG